MATWKPFAHLALYAPVPDGGHKRPDYAARPPQLALHPTAIMLLADWTDRPAPQHQ
jgi:hypothetical protein